MGQGARDPVTGVVLGDGRFLWGMWGEHRPWPPRCTPRMGLGDYGTRG